MINYYLTAHAEERLVQRSIKKEELERVLNDPDYCYPGKKGELNFVKEVSRGRKIRVVAQKDKEEVKIITAVIM
ncbi:MAG: DUF4258 domain-containing protein [Candidatus Aminicenantes bacterium]|nr:DUF4258 domain-containing protein [Candidatus Aminicenantes bacterium]